ncbi:MAG: hypothetical protein RMJ97_12545, partial [Raineya sp.]|nr:hypothetical protein [Raineya sp.]
MKKVIGLCFCLLWGLWACDISKNKEVKPEEVFVKIYENNNFDQNFTPLDIKQTADGGYLILGEYAN